MLPERVKDSSVAVSQGLGFRIGVGKRLSVFSMIQGLLVSRVRCSRGSLNSQP